MFSCRGCGLLVTKSSARVFCSNRCQRDAERAANVARWLDTGIAFPGTKPEHYVRAHIRDEQGGCCAICGRDATWQGLPLVLVLDHIDGDSTNNRRENLRLVCPNCDSQLPTYKMRNKGRGRHSRRLRYAAEMSY